MRGGGKLLTSRAAVVVVLVASRVSAWGEWGYTGIGIVLYPPLRGSKEKG